MSLKTDNGDENETIRKCLSQIIVLPLQQTRLLNLGALESFSLENKFAKKKNDDGTKTAIMMGKNTLIRPTTELSADHQVIIGQ